MYDYSKEQDDKYQQLTPEQQKIYDEQVEQARQLKSSYQKVFTSPEGQKVLKDIIQAAGVLRIEAPDATSHELAYNAGAKSIALRIIQFNSEGPDDYNLL